MKINEILTEEEAPILPKRVTDKELVALLGKGKTNAMLRHPWFQRYSNYQKAYRYAKDKWGFVTVDMFPFFVEHNRTPDGGIRPTIYVSFIFSYSGTKVVQAHQFTRPLVPDEFELNNKITGGWQHGTTWKVDKVKEDTYQPPELHTGDKILKGKFKNSPATIKGFSKDKHNQPVLKTDKGAVQLFKPRVTKLMTNESVMPGTYVHETSPEKAAQIAKMGFKPSYEGIFFNRDGTGYSGGGYGGALITVQLNITKLLDMDGDAEMPEDLDEFADGEEIAQYARSHGYQAWADDLQIAVLDPRCIKIVSIK
jgi:hypothetical protein